MTDEIRRLLLDIVLLDSELNNAPSLVDMARRAKAELDRARRAIGKGG